MLSIILIRSLCLNFLHKYHNNNHCLQQSSYTLISSSDNNNEHHRYINKLFPSYDVKPSYHYHQHSSTMTSLFWRWTMTFIMAFVLSHNGGRALSFPYDDTGMLLRNFHFISFFVLFLFAVNEKKNRNKNLFYFKKRPCLV